MTFARTAALAATAVVALTAAGFAATAADQPVRRDLDWRGDELHVILPARATVTQGPTQRLTVSGPRDLVDRVYLDGDSVRLRPNGLWFWNDDARGLVIQASAPSIRSLSAAASADVRAARLDAPTLKLSASSSGRLDVDDARAADVRLGASSSGRLRVNVKAETMTVKASSSGEVVASGRTGRLDVEASSSGGANLRDLGVEDARIRVSSSGAATVTPHRSVDVQASSSGRVKMASRPPQTRVETSSSGRVIYED